MGPSLQITINSAPKLTKQTGRKWGNDYIDKHTVDSKKFGGTMKSN